MKTPAALFSILLFLAASALAQRLTPLSAPPPWKRLEAFHSALTRDEFTALLDRVFAPGGAWRGVIEVREKDAVIFKTLNPPETMTLRFAENEKSRAKPRRWWRTRDEIPRGKLPLSGLKVVLDPGHIGGKWGVMEERSFARPGDELVQEGDITVRVAKLAAAQLRNLGAHVTLTRSGPAPAAATTVDGLRPAARKELELAGTVEFRENYEGRRDPAKAQTVQWQAEKLFYRVAEIRARAAAVNKRIRPDLVVCIHLNADDWGNPEAPTFTPRDDLHTLVHGCYSAGELRFDDQRFEMLLKLLNGSHAAEAAAAGPVNAAIKNATGLPPFAYSGNNAVRINDDEYLWARNLLASRLFECPVVFLEPWRMNNETTYARLQLGDYEGLRDISGVQMPSLHRQYAAAIVQGVRAAFERKRGK